MALVNCKECGEQISSKAIYCPHCGIQINDTKSMKKSNALAWMAVAFMIIWAILRWVTLK